TFTYTVLDGNGQTAKANVLVTVVGPDEPPSPHADFLLVPAGSGPNPINVLANDTGNGVHVTGLTQGAHGSAALLPFGIGVSYQPAAGYTGTDQFSYTVTDAHGQTASATVTLTVVANLGPVAHVTGPASGLTGQTLTFTVSAGDLSTDPAAGFRYVVDW